MASLDAAVGRIVVSVSNQLAPRLSQLVPPPPPDVDPVLRAYLESPDFAEVARQVVLWRAMRGSLDAGLREQIVQGLRLSGASADLRAVLSALTSAEPLRSGDLDTPTAVGVAHLASAVKNNTLVLRRAPSLADFHAYASQLRTRIAAMHGEMRLPPGTGIPAPATTLLHSSSTTPVDQAEARRLAAQLARSRTPWFPFHYWEDRDTRPARWRLPAHLLTVDLESLLCLPFLEAFVDFDVELPFLAAPHLVDLSTSRRMVSRGGTHPWTPPDDMSEAVADLLFAWATRDFNVFE